MAIYNKTLAGRNLTISNSSEGILRADIKQDIKCCSDCLGTVGSEFKNIFSQDILPGKSVTITLTDGRFVTDITQSSILVESFECGVYLELRDSMITSVIKLFCNDCNCVNTGKTNLHEITEEKIAAMSSLLTYSFQKDYYANAAFVQYLEKSYDTYNCSFLLPEYERLNSLKFLGKYKENQKLLDKFILIYYMGILFMELAENVSDIENISVVYKSCAMKECLNNYGIMFEELENIFKGFIPLFTGIPEVKNTYYTIELQNKVNPIYSICIDNSSFKPTNDFVFKAVRFTSLPTSGILYRVNQTTFEKTPVQVDTEYEENLETQGCLFTYKPNEPFNLVNPFDNFTFEIKGAKVILGVTLETVYSKTGLISIDSETLTVPISPVVPEATLYIPEVVALITNIGVVPEAYTAISNIDDLPINAAYTWSVNPDVSKAGLVMGTVIVTYADGSKDFAIVGITVITLASQYTLIGREIITPILRVPVAADGIANKYEMPAGTVYSWKYNPIVNEAGTVIAIIVATFTDASKLEISVNIVVTAVELNTYALTVSPGSAWGTVIGSSPNGQYYLGDSVIAVANPLTGYNFKHWVDVSSSEVLSANRIYTFNMPEKNIAIAAIFEEIIVNFATVISGDLSVCSRVRDITIKLQKRTANTVTPIPSATITCWGVSGITDNNGLVVLSINLAFSSTGTVPIAANIEGISNTVGEFETTACQDVICLVPVINHIEWFITADQIYPHLKFYLSDMANTIYSNADTLVLYYSTDNGAYWHSSGGPIANARTISFDDSYVVNQPMEIKFKVGVNGNNGFGQCTDFHMSEIWTQTIVINR